MHSPGVSCVRPVGGSRVKRFLVRGGRSSSSGGGGTSARRGQLQRVRQLHRAVRADGRAREERTPAAVLGQSGETKKSGHTAEISRTDVYERSHSLLIGDLNFETHFLRKEN